MLNQDQLLRIGQTAIKYYKSAPFKPTQEDFKEWIDSLDSPMKEDFYRKGLDGCKGVLNFQRFYFEMRDIGMEEFMKMNLTAEDYKSWNDTKGK